MNFMLSCICIIVILILSLEGKDDFYKVKAVALVITSVMLVCVVILLQSCWYIYECRRSPLSILFHMLSGLFSSRQLKFHI